MKEITLQFCRYPHLQERVQQVLQTINLKGPQIHFTWYCDHCTELHQFYGDEIGSKGFYSHIAN